MIGSGWLWILCTMEWNGMDCSSWDDTFVSLVVAFMVWRARPRDLTWGYGKSMCTCEDQPVPKISSQIPPASLCGGWICGMYAMRVI